MERKKIYLSLAKLSYFILYFHFSLCLINVNSFHFNILFTSRCCPCNDKLCHITRTVSLLYCNLPLYTRAVEFAVIGLCLIIICDITFLKVIHVNLDEVWIRFFIRVFQTEFRSQSGRFWMGLNYWNTPFLKRIVS